MKDKDTKRRVLDTRIRDSLSAWHEGADDNPPGVYKQAILPGYEEGRYVPRRSYDRQLFGAQSTDLMKRDSRVNIRVSGSDLERLNEEALRRGIPVQSLLTGIIRDYVESTTETGPVASSQAISAPEIKTDYSPDSTEPEADKGKIFYRA